jgi:hypothetical protein
MVRPYENTNTPASNVIAPARGSVACDIDANARIATAAMPSPSAAATTASTTPSVISCRTSRPRPAPSALRRLISRARLSARTS